jgi:ABC-type transport system involved in Fe-S cluster assembly fused permease/ATPase subunit
MFSKTKCGNSKLVAMEKVDAAVLGDVIKQKNNFNKILKYIKKAESISNKEIDKKLGELNSSIQKAIKKGEGAKVLTDLTLRIEDLSKKKITIDYSDFQEIDIEKFKRLKNKAKGKIFRSIIISIQMYKDYVEIHYGFPIDAKLNNVAKIYYD